MRMKNLFYALGIGFMLTACSSNDEPNAQGEQDFTKSDKYVSVSIVTSSENTRATFDDGDKAEYAVSGVGFYFFDRQGICIDTEFVKETDFSTKGKNENPAVTVIGTIEVNLTANRVYDSVIAILNPDDALMDSEGGLKKKDKAALDAYYADYSGGAFTMSNSVFVNNANFKGAAGFKTYSAVPITSDNIYTMAKKESEMNDKEKEDLQTIRNTKAINIYVERVCAKVSVKNKPSFGAYYIDSEGKKTTIPVVNYVTKDGKVTTEEKNITVTPVFKGLGLSVLSKNARLIKKIDSSLTYSFTDGAITNFTWNDYANKRSYWETTLDRTDEGGGYNYNSWNDLTNPWVKDEEDPTAEEKTSFVEYINPNTIDATQYDNDEADKTTKLLVCAQLTYIPEGKTEAEPLKLVKFSGGFWMADYLLYHAAQRSVEDLAKINYTSITDETERTNAQNEVKKITNSAIKDKLSLIRKTSGRANAYLAALSIKDKNNKYPDLLTGLTGTLKQTVADLVNNRIQQTLDEITERQIQYWNDGMTYFYVPIRHEGFNGLTGTTTYDANNNPIYTHLNGVVRNHLYEISIEKIWGLGTPVINIGDPIDPERPDDAPESYMTAKIHVLKWRVVDSNVTMH